MRIGNWRFTVEHIDPDDDIERQHEDEHWVDKEGKVRKVDDMTNRHVRHTLSMVLRNLRAKNAAVMGKDGRVKFGKVLDELIEDQLVMMDGENIVRLGFFRRAVLTMTQFGGEKVRKWLGEPNPAPIKRKEEP